MSNDWEETSGLYIPDSIKGRGVMKNSRNPEFTEDIQCDNWRLKRANTWKEMVKIRKKERT
jgi:hypothetical protein